MALTVAQPGQSFVKRKEYFDYNGRIMKSKYTVTVHSIYPNKSLELSLRLVVSNAYGDTHIDDTFHYIWNPKTGKAAAPIPRDSHKAFVDILGQFFEVKA